MTFREAPDRDPPKTGYQLQSATGTDGVIWYWFLRNGNGFVYGHRYARREWGWGTHPEYLKAAVARLDEVDWVTGIYEPPDED